MDNRQADLTDITVPIPAHSEAQVIADTLQALKWQGQDLHIILVDDESSDNSLKIALDQGLENL